MTDNCVAKHLKVNGIVQGVGFRPFIFQLAEQYGLKGEVANSSSGVTIHIEGLAEKIALFESDLTAKSPPLAYIVEIKGQPDTVRNYAGFSIAKTTILTYHFSLKPVFAKVRGCACPPPHQRPFVCAPFF
jgi:hydrogenase maturation protein HypF